MIKATNKGAEAIYLFIAELNGYKTGTVEGKLAYGQQCYLDTKIHELDYSTVDGQSEAHENIWLQRLYDDLDKYYDLFDKPLVAPTIKAKGMKSLTRRALDSHQWSVPIELDASASMLQYIGVLLGDKRLLTMTNCHGTELSDPWAFEGMSRTMFKHAATPRLYGSSRACYELWDDWNHEYTLEQVELFNAELASGPLGLADALKEFIINNVKPTEAMTVKIGRENFSIECNRYRQVGEVTTSYDIYDTADKSIRRLHHTATKKVADLDQFRRYFVTLLIHNLDSQVADFVVGKVMEKYGWCIDIHDAFLVNPEAADDVRTWYAQALTDLYTNRASVLSEYFASIGIGSEAQGNWKRVKDMVVPVEDFVCNKMALK